jgi:2-C-methyl-D-erythritol 2,4-cyclodiphosphate synthase
MKPPRIGIGTDIHRLVHGRPCILAGLTLDCPVGPEGHSDGDALMHALCDGLLGAAGMDDLGTLFPDTNPQWKNAASTIFLKETLRLLGEAGMRPVSVDIAIHCDRPRIGPHRANLRQTLAEMLGLEISRINVKGKSLESTNQGPEAIEVTAVVLLSED